MDEGELVCIICGNRNDERVSRLHEKGRNTLLECSRMKHDSLTEDKLIGVQLAHIHASCRRQYTDKRSLNDCEKENSAKKRPSRDGFDWNVHCFFCAENAVVDPKHPDREDVFIVRTLEMKENLLTKCHEERPWNEAVRARLNSCHDLVHPNARYHNRCLKLFLRPVRSSNRPGRPVDELQKSAFNKLCDWLEDEIELRSVAEVHEKLAEISGGENVYSEKSLRDKLQDKYGDHILFSRIGGHRKDVVCFKNMAAYLVSETWHEARHSDADLEANRIIRMAARLIQTEIRTDNIPKIISPSLKIRKISILVLIFSSRD
jgi:hypothetical protein